MGDAGTADPAKYRTTGLLSQSAGAGIYRAVRLEDNCAVVIKTLDPRLRPARELERLRAEYELGRSLDLPGTVKPIALDTYRGMPALVLEHFEGTFLEQLLTGTPLPLERFLTLAIGIAGAVEELHRSDVVHKDLKPDNIVVDPVRGEVKLANLGVASPQQRESGLAPTAGILTGSLPYMSPEQTGRMNRPLDFRSDLYSLGVTFYRMLTGRLPFRASDPLEWIHCHVARRVTPPSALRPSVPEVVSAIVVKLLAKVAEDRYQSARGLRRDLERCLAAWRARGQIEPFPLGEEDLAERPRVPLQLYGRERELAALRGAFEAMVETGAPGVVRVSGYSGVGKSSLVHKLQRPIVQAHGFFLSGKFDQYQRGIPYATISQAFRALVRDILAEPEERVTEWRGRLTAALGLNARLIVDIIPELALVIGEQPPVPELSGSDAQSRFHLVFRQFLGVFAAREHPVALFLDDLQWVDPASLALLSHLITHPDIHYFLWICAYRDNEVSAAHPLMTALARVRAANVAMCDIFLTPLSEEHLASLVTATFGGRVRDAAALARLIHGKTDGNPFFALQFLNMLHQEGLIALDLSTGTWAGDIPRIQAKTTTINVAELMVQTLQRLSPGAREALELAACLGGTSELGLLAALADRPEEEVRRDLAAAVQAGLVLRDGDAYKFAHDRVQEAAFSLIPAAERAAVHLRIGRALLARLGREELEAQLFEVAGHFEEAAHLLERTDEKVRVAALHLAAGRKAQASTAYDAAVRYHAAGSALLGPEAWDEQHSLAFSLGFAQAECEYLRCRFDASVSQFAALFERARTRRERAEIRRVEVDLFTSRQELHTAVERGIEGLRWLGVEVSAHPTRAQVHRELQTIQDALGERQIEDLVDLPPLVDPDMRAALGILAVLFAPALNTDPELPSLCYCRMVEISLRHGNGEASALGYAYFGMVLGPSFGRYREGYQFGKLGYDLAERLGLVAYRAKLHFIFGDCVCSWTQHLQGALRYLESAFQAALQSGDLTFACYCCNHYVVDLLVLGEPLEQVERETERRLEFTRNADFAGSSQVLIGIQRLVRHLLGRTRSRASFRDDAAYEAEVNASPWTVVKCWYFIMKLQGLFISGDYAAALAAGDAAAPLLWCSLAHIQEPEYWYYYALALAAHVSSAAPVRQREALVVLARHEAKLAEWAASCPQNFGHKHALVSAEIARLEGRERDALQCYDRAIRGAREHGFVQNQAIADELLARFYRDRGLEMLAETHLHAARACYVKWEAHAKVRQLDEQEEGLSDGRPDGCEASDTFTAEHVDLLAVTKASQSISSEIVQEKLLRRLLSVVLEQSGARTAHLIGVRTGELTLEASATLDESGMHADLRRRGPEELARLVPASIVQYVQRTGERVLLDDARADPGRFGLDEYVAQVQPRSLLCFPIRRRGTVQDVLYLENSLVPSAFRSEHLTVLELLAAQAAISLENATLLTQEQAARQAAEADHRRAAFLGDASKLLGESLDYEEVLHRLADLCVGSFADWCAIDVVEGQEIRRRTSAPSSPAQAAVLEEIRARYPPRLDSPHPSSTAIRAGAPLLVEMTEENLARYCVDEGHARLLRELGVRTAIVAPLPTGSRILGAITLGSGRPDFHYAAADLDLLVELARRAAMAIDNARLYRQAQAALRLRDEFLSVASHELRTPMTSLTLALQTIVKPTPTGKPLDPQITSKLLDLAIRQSGRMNRLIGDLLDVSRIETWQLALSLGEVELSGLVREVLARFQPDLARAGSSATIEAPAPVVGRWDRSRLEQVVSNILSNAAKFGAGAPIEITVRRLGDVARLTIRDHGLGIDPDRLPKIFDRFERGVSAQNYGGLGLGLYIARKIVEGHCGTIRATSTPGEGTTFIVELPCCASTPPTATGGGPRS
ncbi:trifunctional serine/threonine-protein kinase/ATP-binding protein/sensor histidine kinase [Nannocystis pusilla]|uniref:histidine kinase n=1 Tax=Nannocystis pusilla TaxID=889268 RepID=A0A9X3ETA0_9BACT|nr:ATP-binding sensor histidine kinase [Nannocystis pusilla]MCY1005073.1 trifunctional serine/threonine-protein kinase/ATP-binding protein/sensor histidine kinase [Nannocystis pusilla]